MWSFGFPPEIGGSEVLADRLIRTLQPQGFDFLVVAPLDGGVLPAEDTHAGIPVHRFAFQRVLAECDGSSVLEIRRRVAEIKRAFAPHLVHINAFHPGIFFHLATARVSPVPSLLTLHGWPDLDFGTETAQGRLVRSVDWVAACSASTLEKARRDVPEIVPISSVIRNALEAPSIAPAPLPFDPPRILCLGRLVEEKGFDLALSAVASLTPRSPPARLMVAGDGPARAGLEAQAARLGLRDRTEFTGWIRHEAVTDLINQSTLVVVPSRIDEPFGLVALEAALMARPVVATNVGGLAEVVRHTRTGLVVDDGDVPGIAMAIAHLLDHPEAATRMGLAARRRARAGFGWKAYADGYADLYRTLTWEATHG
jgi:glycogen(starch) synthase